MFCKNCGKEISGDAMFCNFCGTAVDNIVHINFESETPETQQESISGNDDDMENDPTPEKDVAFTVLGHQIKGRLIMKIAAVIAAICFFCPMFMVSCSGVEVMEVGMSDLMLGSGDTSDNDGYYNDYDYDTSDSSDSEKCFGMVIFLLMPLSAFGTCMISKAEKGWGQEAANIFGSTALGLLLVYRVACNNIASSEYAYYGVEITPLFSFYLYLAMCVIGMCIGIKVARTHNEYRLVNAQPGTTVKKHNVILKTLLCSAGGALLVLIFYFILNEI